MLHHLAVHKYVFYINHLSYQILEVQTGKKMQLWKLNIYRLLH